MRGSLALPPVMTRPILLDLRAWFVMGSYKVTDKFTAQRLIEQPA